MMSQIAAVPRVLGYLLSHPVAGRRPVQALARLASWQVRSRLSPGPHRHPWINGSTLIVRRGMVGATGNIYLGLHEFADMGFVLHFLRADDVFFDIGANVGSYTVLASKACGARCHSFEPDPDTVGHLRQNITGNAVEALVTVHEIALGADNGVVGFTVGLDTVNRVATAGERQRIVAVRRLDDVVAESAVPQLIKMDVEGHEDAVFSGAKATLGDPRLLAVEAETTGQASLDLLQGFGFVRRYYDPYHRRLSATPLAWHDNNSLFVRDEAQVTARLKQAAPIKIFGLSI